MIRIAHLADTHIGMENYGRVNPETGLNSRLGDFLRSMDQAIDSALASQVDLFVIAGDIYKTRDPTPTHQREFAQRVRRIVEAGVPVFIVAGNHDIPLSTGRATSVDIFRALDVPRVTVTRAAGLHRIETASGPVQVLAMPWALRSNLANTAAHKNKTIAHLNQEMLDFNRARLQELARQADQSTPSIVVSHAHVMGARVGAERLLTMGADPMYDVGAYDLPGVDYVALGHIHKHQALERHPPIVYAGSLDRVDFGEEGEDKGWVFVEIPEKGKAEWEFRKVDARKFLTIEANVGPEGNATEAVIKAIARRASEIPDAVVKLRIDIDADRLAELRDDDIRAELRGASFIAPVERNVRRVIRNRWVGADIAVQHSRPFDALTYYLEHQNVEPKRRAELLQYACQLMDGEGCGDVHAEVTGEEPEHIKPLPPEIRTADSRETPEHVAPEEPGEIEPEREPVAANPQLGFDL